MAKSKSDAGNFVSEWFGHRVYPSVVSSAQAIADQNSERCPFLSQATGEDRVCIKNVRSRGVCSVSCPSNGVRQDWLVCPYRALSPEIVNGAVRRLFGLPDQVDPFVTPAVNLVKEEVRSDIHQRLEAGQPVFTYFDEKMGGELSIPATDKSPEFAFDVTIIEITLQEGVPEIGRFGILEIQTTDFHGSYQHAVRNLKDGLRLHKSTFADTLQKNQGWLSDGIEGPNIANVFKRTFYQMMFKFQLGQHGRCAGCILAIPKSVWDSWDRHLGNPQVIAEPDGTFSLLKPGQTRSAECPAWIFVFDPDAASATTPSPIIVNRTIGTDAPSFSYWALEVAPEAAVSNIDAEAGFLASLSRRMKGVWPALAKAAVVEKTTAKGRKKKMPIQALEKDSDYDKPGPEAVKSDPRDTD
ncbi:hypothetical protein JJE66_27170 [Bradyrhizobium diazoefficiens]|uniref:hypothetical protein n=1 Tax=Bradyrhizobium diazoefficiens TaxID=1355477 RepID=UPI00190B6B2C|nr:hypothetical protein [Bradyrhizobium diazoefficiens]MBK3664896.1 hypothetical protein [Bradyrhizobium diazoefficiens]